MPIYGLESLDFAGGVIPPWKQGPGTTSAKLVEPLCTPTTPYIPSLIFHPCAEASPLAFRPTKLGSRTTPTTGTQIQLSIHRWKALDILYHL